MKKLNVLITGAGAPGIAGTIYSLRNNPEQRQIKIITTDINDEAVGQFFSDSFYKVPKPDNPLFIPRILEICEKEKIDVVLPQVTRELSVFARNISLFNSNRINVVVNDANKLKVANNKFNISSCFQDLGFNQGVFSMVWNKEELVSFSKRIGYPENSFVIKLPVSNGMRGFRIISDQETTLDEFINTKPSGERIKLKEIMRFFDEGLDGLLAMEYCPGLEYSVDVFRSPLNKQVIVVPRSRRQIRSGITFEGILERETTLIEMSESLAKALDLFYCFGFQFKRNKDGGFCLLECNPRVQGTMIMAVMGGANMIYWAVKESVGEEVDLSKVNIRWGLCFKRYWAGVSIHDESVGFVK